MRKVFYGTAFIMIAAVLSGCTDFSEKYDDLPDPIVQRTEISGEWSNGIGAVIIFSENGLVEGQAHCRSFVGACGNADNEIIDFQGTWQICYTEKVEDTNENCDDREEGNWIQVDLDEVVEAERMDRLMLTGGVGDRALYRFSVDSKADDSEYYTKDL